MRRLGPHARAFAKQKGRGWSRNAAKTEKREAFFCRASGGAERSGAIVLCAAPNLMLDGVVISSLIFNLYRCIESRFDGRLIMEGV